MIFQSKHNTGVGRVRHGDGEGSRCAGNNRYREARGGRNCTVRGLNALNNHVVALVDCTGISVLKEHTGRIVADIDGRTYCTAVRVHIILIILVAERDVRVCQFLCICGPTDKEVQDRHCRIKQTVVISRKQLVQKVFNESSKVALIEDAVDAGDHAGINQVAAGNLVKQAVQQIADDLYDCRECTGRSQNAVLRNVEHADRRYDVEIKQSADKVVSQRGLKPGLTIGRCNIENLLNRKQGAEDSIQLHPRILCGCKVDCEGAGVYEFFHLPGPFVIIAKRPVNDPVNRFFPLLRVSFELAECISFGFSKFIAVSLVFTEVSKVSQIGHTNVHADGQADIKPVVVVFAGHEGLGVVI